MSIHSAAHSGFAAPLGIAIQVPPQKYPCGPSASLQSPNVECVTTSFESLTSVDGAIMYGLPHEGITYAPTE
jgi:hypothetical protein